MGKDSESANAIEKEITMKPAKFVPQATDARNTLSALFMAVVFVSTIAMPEIAMAQSEFQTKTCGFLSNITGLLNIASIAVVTIGIIFAFVTGSVLPLIPAAFAFAVLVLLFPNGKAMQPRGIEYR